ncbi:MAG TPA: hypothetical protein VMU94_29045 [Streptosporangiaceae bacterium]|nr:hypothetical protein [Streptosporangiaceae bacterium]
MHVEVDLEGTTVGGVLCTPGTWVPGVVVGTDAMAITLTVQRAEPIGGHDLVSVEPARARPRDPAAFGGTSIPEDVIALGSACPA